MNLFLEANNYYTYAPRKGRVKILQIITIIYYNFYCVDKYHLNPNNFALSSASGNKTENRVLNILAV